MKIKLENYRTFRETDFIDIRPLNILIGENSSGKTSFSAAAKFVYDIFSGEAVASFNSEPFFLGSFRDIAHYRGGRAGRAKSFSFHIKLNVRARDRVKSEQAEVVSDLFGVSPQDINAESEITITLNFEELKSQASLADILISTHSQNISLKFQKNTVAISDGFGDVVETRVPLRSVAASYFFDLSYLSFVLRDVRYLERRMREPLTKGQEDIIRKVEFLSDLIIRSTGQISLSTIATAPVRTEPKRVYQISERDTQKTSNQAAYDLAQLSAFEIKEWSEIKRGLEDFGEKAGLFRQINVRHLSPNKDGPFQIEVKIGKQTSNIIDVGYGVSQALPLVFDLLRATKKSVFFIQQPEVHLHPQAQVQLASMACEIAKKKNHTIFIETHSDFIIDRIRSDVRDYAYLDGDDVNLLFFHRADLESRIHQIMISKSGEIVGAPENYRSFFLREKMKSLGVR